MKPLRVLVVDDDDIIRSVVTRTITRAGYVVVVAEDGQQAIQKISEDDFDAIICDMEMPCLNGEGVLRAIRASHPHLIERFAFHTSKTEEAEALHNVVLGKCQKAEILAFLAKRAV